MNKEGSVALQFVSPAPWMKNEKTEYSVKMRSGEKGMEEIGSLKFFLSSERMKVKREALCIRSEIKMFNVNFNEKTRLIIDEGTFKPVQYTSSVSSPTGHITLHGEYSSSAVKVSVENNGMHQNYRLRLSGEAYDNGEVIHILRALPFRDFPKARFTVVNLLALNKTAAVVESLGIEPVDISLGTFECYRVKLAFPDFPSGKQFFFYETKNPHLLVKNIKGPQVIELVDVSHE